MIAWQGDKTTTNIGKCPKIEKELFRTRGIEPMEPILKKNKE